MSIEYLTWVYLIGDTVSIDWALEKFREDDLFEWEVRERTDKFCEVSCHSRCVPYIADILKGRRDLTVVAAICDGMGNQICIEAGVQSFWIGQWQRFDQWGLCREDYERLEAEERAQAEAEAKTNQPAEESPA